MHSIPRISLGYLHVYRGKIVYLCSVYKLSLLLCGCDTIFKKKTLSFRIIKKESTFSEHLHSTAFQFFPSSYLCSSVIQSYLSEGVTEKSTNSSFATVEHSQKLQKVVASEHNIYERLHNFY